MFVSPQLFYWGEGSVKVRTQGFEFAVLCNYTLNPKSPSLFVFLI